MFNFKFNLVYFVLARLSTRGRNVRGGRRVRWSRNGLSGSAFYLVFVLASVNGADLGTVVGVGTADPSRNSVGADAAIPLGAHIHVGPGTDRIDRGVQVDNEATLTAADIYASNVGVIESNLNDTVGLVEYGPVRTPSYRTQVADNVRKLAESFAKATRDVAPFVDACHPEFGEFIRLLFD
jgi:hypothetical protein